MGDEPFELDVNDLKGSDVVAEAPTPEVSSAPETPAKDAPAPEAKSEEPTKEAPKVDEDASLDPDEEVKAEEPKAETPKPEEPTTEDAPKAKSAEARKEALNLEIRDLVSKRNELKGQVEAANATAGYRAQTPEELIEAGYDPTEARLLAMEQRGEMAEYNAKVTELTTSLEIEARQVMTDFPIFNPDAPEYNAAIATRAAEFFKKNSGIQYDDKTGYPTQANLLPYDVYKQFADVYTESTKSAQVAGQRAAERNLAASETPSVAAPRKAAVSAFERGFDSDI